VPIALEDEFLYFIDDVLGFDILRKELS